MSGYRCVNFDALCRLCSSAGNNNIQIFADESLQKKISECLPIALNEKDRLPKVICSQCLEYVQIFTEFRQSCSKAQKMLESCLNTSKLRNGGQVYIKDEVPVKKVLKPIQNPSPTKLIPNLCNIVTSTPTKQVKKSVLTTQNQTDFLSSIMQAVGIQANDEVSDSITFSQNIAPQQATMQNVPQYTLTLDGGTLKSGQIQYKIENTANLNTQSQAQLTAKTSQDQQSMSVEEFLKLSKKPMVLKKNPMVVQELDESKNKKPKFNLILQASPQKQKLAVSPALKSFGTPSTQNTPTKPHIQIHNIEKIMPATNQTSPTKQLMLPIMVRNDGTRNADAAQLISQAISMSSNQSIESKASTQPFAYVQMKIQPNADGQLTLTPASAVQAPQHLQLSLSPQQLQQLSFQAPQQQQMQPQITVTQMSTQEQTDSQTQTTAPVLKQETPLDIDDGDDGFDNDNDYEDNFYMENENDEDSQDKVETPPAKTFIVKKAPKTIKPAKKVKSENLTELQAVQQGHSELAKKQLNQLTSFNTKRAESEANEKPSTVNLTVCDVCKKVFKRKEFLMQHLKSHIGLRPFKCDDASCNKSFSRKEHLLRHAVSHSGRKMFNCDVCNKLFSRKDNLNKHRRIHPESGQQTIRHNCPTCSKGFSHRAQLAKHQLNCDGSSIKTEAAEKEEKTRPPSAVKKAKPKPEKKPAEIPPKPSPPVQQTQAVVQKQQQPQILTILQQPQQQLKSEPQQQQQIILSMSQAQAMLQTQQSKGAVYTFPTNLILNSSGAFMTNTGEVVGNFKFDNQ